MNKLPFPSNEIMTILKKGCVIPASPLALDENKKIDEKYQRAIYRYYADAGAGGIAVGVHTTQFEIREPQYNLFKTILKFASDEISGLEKQHCRELIKIAGICGRTVQAVREAEYAVKCGYDIGLLSLGAMKNCSDDELINHCIEISKIIPLFGFYLQSAVGGSKLSFNFWKRFCEIENVVGIKMAPFNRYQTLDVVRALAFSGREEEITLYTGNDDNIIIDLLTPFKIRVNDKEKQLRIKGGLLGQWAVWTKKAVEMLSDVHKSISSSDTISIEWLTKNAALTDANSVVFDVVNNFKGCIAGINEVLRRNGLMRFSHCLSPDEKLSDGQSNELDRINRDYQWLKDDDFIKKNIEKWLN